MLPFAKERMDAALAHLEELSKRHLGPASTTAVVINLQECLPEDLTTIGQKQWVQDKFHVTDVDHAAWASAAYGTTMLVDRRLKITSSFRLHYSKTRMERDALFVDVAAPLYPTKTLRLCNTHLESLALEPPFRPLQMQLIAKYMHANELSGAIVAGDFNAIQPSDVSIHTDNGLKDAYLELGGEQTGDKGFTWGQQVLPPMRQQFGFSRMDKVFFRGDGLWLQSLSKFGVDILVEDEEAANRLLALGFEKPWVTDHLGLAAIFNFTSDSRL
jgi:tyrosyl-DNA phosphodiesterase 2